MDESLARALIAAARAFADELEHGQTTDSAVTPPAPKAGTARSLEVLRSVASINEDQERGVSDEEIRLIAGRAGMDPRGMAGYYRAGFLEKRDDGTRWLSPAGRERLTALTRAHVLGPASRDEESPGADGIDRMKPRGTLNTYPHVIAASQ